MTIIPYYANIIAVGMLTVLILVLILALLVFLWSLLREQRKLHKITRLLNASSNTRPLSLSRAVVAEARAAWIEWNKEFQEKLSACETEEEANAVIIEMHAKAAKLSELYLEVPLSYIPMGSNE